LIALNEETCFNKNNTKFSTAIKSYKLILHDFPLFRGTWIKNTDAIKRNMGTQCTVKLKLNVKVKVFPVAMKANG
jgi:hypothetical protein